MQLKRRRHIIKNVLKIERKQEGKKWVNRISIQHHPIKRHMNGIFCFWKTWPIKIVYANVYREMPKKFIQQKKRCYWNHFAYVILLWKYARALSIEHCVYVEYSIEISTSVLMQQTNVIEIISNERELRGKKRTVDRDTYICPRRCFDIFCTNQCRIVPCICFRNRFLIFCLWRKKNGICNFIWKFAARDFLESEQHFSSTDSNPLNQ